MLEGGEWRAAALWARASYEIVRRPDSKIAYCHCYDLALGHPWWTPSILGKEGALGVVPALRTAGTWHECLFKRETSMMLGASGDLLLHHSHCTSYPGAAGSGATINAGPGNRSGFDQPGQRDAAQGHAARRV